MNLSLPPQPSELTSFLSQTMMFQDLSIEQLAEIARIAIAQSYSKGDVIFHQGDEGIGFLWLNPVELRYLKYREMAKNKFYTSSAVATILLKFPPSMETAFQPQQPRSKNWKYYFFPANLFATIRESAETSN